MEAKLVPIPNKPGLGDFFDYLDEYVHQGRIGFPAEYPECSLEYMNNHVLPQSIAISGGGMVKNDLQSLFERAYSGNSTIIECGKEMDYH